MTDKMSSLRVNINQSLYQKVRFKALTLNITVADVVREKLRLWVEEEKPIVLPPPTQPTGSIITK